jgi:hypothetical protein
MQPTLVQAMPGLINLPFVHSSDQDKWFKCYVVTKELTTSEQAQLLRANEINNMKATSREFAFLRQEIEALRLSLYKWLLPYETEVASARLFPDGLSGFYVI